MRPIKSSATQQRKLFASAVSGIWLSLTIGLLPISNHVTSSAFAQSAVSSSRQQAASEPSTISSHLLSSATQQTQGRKHHSLIRKPASSKMATIAPSAVATDTTTSPLSEQIPVSNMTPNTASSQPVTSESFPQANRIQQNNLTAVSSTASIAGNAAVQSSLSSATNSTLSGSTGLTAAAGGSSSGNANGSRGLHRLLSEMPGMSQLITPTSTTPTPPSTPSPAIGASPSSFSFTAQQGGGNPAAQALTISNTGGGTLTWSASDTATWLTLSPASGTGTGAMTLTVATGTLTTGTYTTTLTLSATGAAPVSVPVTFTVIPASTTITLTPSSLSYSGVQGGSTPANQSVTVTSNGSWTASSDTSWLMLSQTSGSGNGTITAGINLGNALAGTNTGTITVTGGGTSRTVSVTLTVTAASLTVLPNSLSFTATQGEANPASQTISISSNQIWTASDDASWLSLSGTSGSSNGTIIASINTASLAIGNHTGTITVIGGGFTRTASVTLTLNTPATSSAALTWNANTEIDLAGYKVYRSTSSGVYGDPIATLQGNVTSYIATGLQSGTTYFFVITAYDNAGNESAYSSEVSKSIF